MIDYSSAKIDHISVHHIGNQNKGEDLISSKTELNVSDARLSELLIRYFLAPFTAPAYYSFTFTNEDFKMNPLYIYASQIFDNTKLLHDKSVDIAKHLYEMSDHPQIKPGDLFIVHFNDVVVGGIAMDAIGIFKSENRQSFLKLDATGNSFYINYDDGINIEKLDKGCMILNAEKETGYKICVVDKSNKIFEAQYWIDSFLMLKTQADKYHKTKDFLDITKNFVTKQLAEEFVVNKADQIDMLNKSMDYFKTHDNFNKKEFEKEVLNDAGIIKSFRKFDETYREDYSIQLDETFEISPHAVKKQARIFKSVLKLDKNFHIYIHGNRELIEQGVEKDGRKFYKIYFENEI